MNLNFNQIVAITIAVLGVLAASTVQLTDLFGPMAAKTVISVATLLTSVLSAILAAITGQGSMVRGVQDMPGVEKIVVNSEANKTLAQLAVDPQQPKIEAAPEDLRVVKATAARH